VVKIAKKKKKIPKSLNMRYLKDYRHKGYNIDVQRIIVNKNITVYGFSGLGLVEDAYFKAKTLRDAKKKYNKSFHKFS